MRRTLRKNRMPRKCVDSKTSGDALSRLRRAVAQGPDGKFRPVGHPKLSEDPVQIFLDGPLSEMQFMGNLFV